MTDAERIVRAAWENVAVKSVVAIGAVCFWWVIPQVSLRHSVYISEDEAWQAALAYTKEHAEKIRQLEEEVFKVRDHSQYLFNWKQPEDAAIFARTLLRLEAQLTDLRKGWKG